MKRRRNAMRLVSVSQDSLDVVVNDVILLETLIYKHLRMFRLVDSEGHTFYKWVFRTFMDATNFKAMMGRPDWQVINQ